MWSAIWSEITSMISDPKLHSTLFNYHFIKSILKSHNFMAVLLEIAEPKTLWYLIQYVKRCHVTKTHSSITNKQAVLKWGELRTKTISFNFSFMDQSSILVAWINDGGPSFLLWLRLRLHVVFGEGIWGCSRCNSAMDFFWVVKLPRLHDARSMWIVYSFKYRSMALYSAWF